MKKLFLLGAACCALMMSCYADYAGQAGGAYGAGYGQAGQPGQVAQGGGQMIYDNACPQQDCPCDQPLNDCYCLYAHYNPCYYCVPRCVEEQIPYKETCCRMVPQYYQVQKCRMVPEYYNETCCRQVPEYYQVDRCRTCRKTVYDQHCTYKPCYYWKHVCGNPSCTAPTPSCPAVPRGGNY